MRRMRKACERSFRESLLRVRARRAEQGVQWLVAKAQRLSAGDGLRLADALTRVYQELLERLCRRASAQGLAAQTQDIQASQKGPPSVFCCDAGLGGLARWLRAAGYEAHWVPDIGDDALVRQAQGLGAVLLTTDSGLMERRLLRDGVVPGLWLPPTLRCAEQLALVFHARGLKRQPPRCMSCGGALRSVEKESMRDRIPPKTWRWIDQYFLCDRCGKLFWHGTHWRGVVERLKRLDR